MRSRGRRLVSLVVALLVGAVYFTPLVAAARAGCGNVRTSGPWTTIRPPKARAGEQRVVDHAIDPTTVDTIYATNGSVIAVSTNGGCDWRQPYPSGPAGALPTTIKGIDSPSIGVAVAMGQRGPDVAGAPSIALTENEGETWEEGGIGLPPVGTVEFLESPGDAQRALFLGIDEGAGAADLLYFSNDNGRTWSLRSDLSNLKPSMQIYGLAADPLDPQVVWAYGPGGLWESKNEGRSFDAVNELAGENVVAADVIHEMGEPARVMALLGGKTQVMVSSNGGRNFNVVAAPPGADSVDHGSADWDFAITASGETYRYDPSTAGWLDLAAPSDGTVDMTGVRGATPLGLSVHTAGTIDIYRDPLAGSSDPERVGGNNYSLNETAEFATRDATFGPPGKRIVLKAGEEKTIPYTLTIPPRRVPLDVYFLVDTSSSMKNTIDSLAARLADITNALVARKIDVQFGLAVYRSYPNTSFPPRPECPSDQQNTPGVPCEKNYVYEPVVQITRDTAPLEAGFENLIADAGGSYDAHLEALKATVSGEPVDLPPRGVENRYDVGPGEQAKFRDKSVRVVIHATDEAFGKTDPDGDNDNEGPIGGPAPDIPDQGPIEDEFNANRVEHLGLSVGRLPYKDMQKMSTATGTVANKDVDCDQNGVIDIPVGAPLVCKLFADDLASEIPDVTPSVVGLLEAVQERTTVGLEAKRGDEVIKRVTPDMYTDMVLQTANELPFSVTYRCARSQAGERFPVTIAPTSDGVDLSDLGVDAQVICAEEKREKGPFLPPALLPIPLVGLVIPPPPPPPPAPVTQLNPASQTQAQAQGQAQAAAATQEEEQPQLAYVTAYEDALENEFAMSAYDSRRRGLPPGAALGIGAVSVSLMYGAGLALRRRTRVERARY